MPLYRFETTKGSQTDRVGGLEFEDNDAARLEAITSSREALIDGILEGVDAVDWVTRVYDEAGYLVATVGYKDILDADGVRGDETQAKRSS